MSGITTLTPFIRLFLIRPQSRIRETFKMQAKKQPSCGEEETGRDLHYFCPNRHHPSFQIHNPKRRKTLNKPKDSAESLERENDLTGNMNLN